MFEEIKDKNIFKMKVVHEYFKTIKKSSEASIYMCFHWNWNNDYAISCFEILSCV